MESMRADYSLAARVWQAETPRLHFRRIRMQRRNFITSVCASPFLTGLAVAQTQAQGFPGKPIRLIVPFPPGGSTDIAARALADPLAQLLGQPVLVDNRGGAGGSLAMAELVKAAPDGYTLGVATASTHGANSAIYRKLPYDPLKDFAPITQLMVSANVMVAHPSTPGKNYAEFLKYLKANPGKLAYASPGNGSLGHLNTELYKMSTNTFMLHIPYRGAGPAKNDLLAGLVHVMMDNLPSSLAQIKGGHLRALAVAAPQRLPELPDVPTFAELSLFANNDQSWFGLLAPGGTPNAIVRGLNKAVATVLSDKAFKTRLHAMGLEAAPTTPEDFKARITKEIDKWTRVARLANVALD
jgi:tripartite-type tricarboxylate transporter receptor subunit TctC